MKRQSAKSASLAKAAFEIVARQDDISAEQAIRRDREILEDSKEQLASFYQALFAEIKAMGLPTDETSLAKLIRVRDTKWWRRAIGLKKRRSADKIDAIRNDAGKVDRIEEIYLPAILKAMAATGTSSEQFMAIVSKHTGLPVQAFCASGFIGAGFGGA